MSAVQASVTLRVAAAIPVFSVTENIMLGSETDHRSRGAGPIPPLDRLERKTVAAMVRELSHKYGLEVDPEALVDYQVQL